MNLPQPTSITNLESLRGYQHQPVFWRRPDGSESGFGVIDIRDRVFRVVYNQSGGAKTLELSSDKPIEVRHLTEAELKARDYLRKIITELI